MATKMKGIYKSFKFISQIFVVKEREMEIGYPTDVKHVAHIGLDGPSGNAPNWMNEFKMPEFSTSRGDMGDVRDSNTRGISTSSSLDFELSMDHPKSDRWSYVSPKDHPHEANKHKRKNTRSTTPSKSSEDPQVLQNRKSRIMEGKQHLIH